MADTVTYTDKIAIKIPLSNGTDETSRTININGFIDTTGFKAAAASLNTALHDTTSSGLSDFVQPSNWTSASTQMWSVPAGSNIEVTYTTATITKLDYLTP